MKGKCPSESGWLSETEKSDSLCLFEGGGGGRRGTGVADLDSVSLGCVSGSLGEISFVSFSRARESSCTITSSTFASFVTSEPC